MYESGQRDGNSQMFNSSNTTLWVYAHQASMDVGFLSQGSPTLPNNLLPEVKKGMDESGYGVRLSY